MLKSFLIIFGVSSARSISIPNWIDSYTTAEMALEQTTGSYENMKTLPDLFDFATAASVLDYTDVPTTIRTTSTTTTAISNKSWWRETFSNVYDFFTGLFEINF